MKIATQMFYEVFYKVHESKKRKLYNMRLEDAMKNGVKTKSLVKLIELTGDILNMEVKRNVQ